MVRHRRQPRGPRPHPGGDTLSAGAERRGARGPGRTGGRGGAAATAGALVLAALALAALVLATLALATLAAGAATARSAPPPPAAHPLAAFPDGPPARVTGGFGEGSCAACHFDFDRAPPPGALTVAGLPGCYRKGERHELVVELRDPDMKVAGFQLAVRFAADTAQAGRLAAPAAERDRVAIFTDRDVQFAHQTLDGAALETPGLTRWRVDWHPPAGAGQRVLLHAAGLAADGDYSQAGDRVYAVELATGGGGCGA